MTQFSPPPPPPPRGAGSDPPLAHAPGTAASPQNQLAAERSSLIKKLRNFPLVWPLLALALLLLVNVIHNLGFFHIGIVQGRLYGSPVDILNRGAPVMLMSLGMALVIGTGGIDLSVGAVMAISGAMAASLLVPDKTIFAGFHPQGVAVAIGAGLLAATLAGAWNGLLVAVFKVQPIIATLVLMVAGRGIAQLITGGFQTTIEPGPFSFLGRGTFLWLPFPVTIVIVAAILTLAFTRLTAMGLFIESIGNNPVASTYAGIPERLIKFIAYAFSGLCAGVAGLINTSDILSADPTHVGLYNELDAILAVAVGGTALTGGRFSLLGALLGALIMQTLETTLVSANVPNQVNIVLKALVVLIICLLQSERFRALVGRAFGAGRRVVPA
jgi:simple sugar transport system permease protein